MKPLLFSLLLLLATALANVEKIIFTAPQPFPLQTHQPIFDDLEIERLSPQTPSTRTYITASFPSEDAPNGFESWFYLDSLKPGQRYEVRICYLATQPTTFTLTTHTLSDLLDSPSLISSLTTFATTHLPTLLHQIHHEHHQHDSSPEHPSKNQPPPLNLPPKLSHHSPRQPNAQPSTSALFLQVHAAADYFTLDKELMQNVPPVHADIILDPFLFNVFPKSLVPTALYILAIAAGAGVVSWLVWVGVEGVVGASRRKEKKKGVKEGGKKDI
ncbi:hypothetical protein AJ79_00245 [Helicocarpus griseus UAMH5409]|uniref:Protein PBN1 n=1 Tax=Helicocarpus griseus UAMH5409 TaxID=1447875 RepID=A0A2B7YD87_9EURO|nr:hypothetical protein AJ79_00245 [Helicocarpus griseus UAMH5409]